jgi:hypothetical protein
MAQKSQQFSASIRTINFSEYGKHRILRTDFGESIRRPGRSLPPLDPG